jgi:glycosyltransferase involved in cell wall biosynthesis
MKISFISNYLSHHQLPFCLEIQNLLEGQFNFIATTPTNPARLTMYSDMNNAYSFVVRAYESDVSMKKAIELSNSSDVVIIGSAPDCFIEQRLKDGKLTFKYSERLFKEGLSLKNILRAVISIYIHHGKFRRYPLYMLCASAYTAGDLALLRNYYKGKMYRWGYFPELKEYDIELLMKSKNSGCIKILWAGRFLEWKHPETVVAVAKRLVTENVNFKIKMIGDGQELARIKKMSAKMELENHIDFLGAMTPNDVRRHMELTNIVLFTSDFNEGWGAVLNEAMNSGCAVVASHAIGSVPFLVKNHENGVIYVNGDVGDMCTKVATIACNTDLCEKLGRNAYLTLKNTWNAKVAAERLMKLIDHINKSDSCDLYTDGPCSIAEKLQNDWFKG